MTIFFTAVVVSVIVFTIMQIIMDEKILALRVKLAELLPELDARKERIEELEKHDPIRDHAAEMIREKMQEINEKMKEIEEFVDKIEYPGVYS